MSIDCGTEEGDPTALLIVIGREIGGVAGGGCIVVDEAETKGDDGDGGDCAPAAAATAAVTRGSAE